MSTCNSLCRRHVCCSKWYRIILVTTWLSVYPRFIFWYYINALFLANFHGNFFARYTLHHCTARHEYNSSTFSLISFAISTIHELNNRASTEGAIMSSLILVDTVSLSPVNQENNGYQTDCTANNQAMHCSYETSWLQVMYLWKQSLA